MQERKEPIDNQPKVETLSHNKKKFHVDAKTEEWAEWRRVASFRYKPDGEKCYLEVLTREYETVRFCRYIKGELWVLKGFKETT